MFDHLWFINQSSLLAYYTFQRLMAVHNETRAALRTLLVEDEGQDQSGFCPNKVKKSCDIIPVWIIVRMDVMLRHVNSISWWQSCITEQCERGGLWICWKACVCIHCCAYTGFLCNIYTELNASGCSVQIFCVCLMCDLLIALSLGKRICCILTLAC